MMKRSSDGSHGYIPPRVRALAAALRRARDQRDMTMRELSARLSIAQSKISDIENGKAIPDFKTVGLILGQLQTSPDERERIFEMLQKVGEPNWLTVGYPGITEQLANVVDHEKAAESITDWSLILIPGLLQTPEYARSLVESTQYPGAGSRTTSDLQGWTTRDIDPTSRSSAIVCASRRSSFVRASRFTGNHGGPVAGSHRHKQ